MKRTAHPPLSPTGQEALASYEDWLREREAHVHDCFMPQGITTPALTRYRTYVQMVQRQKSASVNSSLISFKRYFGWATQQHHIPYDPSVLVKLVGQEESAYRHLDDQEGQALVAALTKTGALQDRVLIVLLLHTGLQAREICRLRRDQAKQGKSGGFLEIIGECNKYRGVPLNVTAHKMLEEYLPTLLPDAVFLFPSDRAKKAPSERNLGYIVKKYAQAAKLLDVSPHDLCHRFYYRMAESVPLHRLAQIMGHDSLDTTKIYIQGTKRDLQQAVETIA
jgi:integrase/recombinase XerD